MAKVARYVGMYFVRMFALPCIIPPVASACFSVPSSTESVITDRYRGTLSYG